MDNIKTVEVGYSTSEINEIDNELALELINDGGAVTLAGTRDEVIDVVESIMASHPQVECPLVHRFTNNMYIREIFVPAGTLLTSKIHKYEHPFVLSKGSISILDGEGGQMDISAPFCGITKENTRRIVFVHEDCVFTTFHVTDKKTVEEVEDEILIKHDNPLLDNSIKELLKLK
jgi:hypothetical protein